MAGCERRLPARRPRLSPRRRTADVAGRAGYKPAAKRRWGYFALPALHHDRLVGKLDAKADRKAGTFSVNALHEDVRFTKAMRSDVEAEIEALAAWLGLRIIRGRDRG